jgi:hypothetical protein
VGITFLIMGVSALLFALWSLATSLADLDESPAAAAPSTTADGGLSGFSAGSSADFLRGPEGMTWIGPPGSKPGASGGDTVSKLERLHQLRLSGALTEREFEREKAKLLAGM